MFRHQGNERTDRHNLGIAVVLSFVAGMVNITGFLSIQRLTTNVTGHFALFVFDLAHFDFWKGAVYFLYLVAFLLGSFSSGLMIQVFRRKHWRNILVVPVCLESLILLSIPVLVSLGMMQPGDLMACLLLYAMGLQNASVTQISNAVVRTTHLTGLFTDLGLELSRLFTSEPPIERARTLAMIRLRASIIGSFFLGGLIGGYFYSGLGFELMTLAIAAAILLIGLVVDRWWLVAFR